VVLSVGDIMPRVRCYTLKQAVEMIMQNSDSENEETVDVCILPPNDGADSEVEAIDDDDLSPNEPADLCGEIDIFTRLTDSETEGATEQPVVDTGHALLKSRNTSAAKSRKQRLRLKRSHGKKVTSVQKNFRLMLVPTVIWK